MTTDTAIHETGHQCQKQTNKKQTKDIAQVGFPQSTS